MRRTRGRGYFLTKFRGYLDRLRENVEALDEAIATARANSKAKKGSDSRTALQWAKTLRDLIELRNTTLEKVKVHLLGRDETGAPNEPDECFDGNPEIMFERTFQWALEPWTRERLKLTCKDCGGSSEEVSDAYIESEGEHMDLCPTCYEKREAKKPKEES
jgi:hypothetical protein